MTSNSLRWLIPLAMVAAVAGSGCGSSVTCGPDTREESGVCVAKTLSSCPEGTVLADGACRDACGAGTVFKNGQCTVADAICGAGTELVDGSCRMVDALARVTLREATEPNNAAANAARFELPGVGAAPVVLGGVVAAPRATEADLDGYVFTATAGQRIRLEGTAVGLPAIAMVLEPVSSPGRLRRYVVSLDQRDASRELVLPIGGEWILWVSDAANLDLGGQRAARGGELFTYTVAVSQVAAANIRTVDASGLATGQLVDGDRFALAADPANTRLVHLELPTPDGQLPYDGIRSLWATDAAGRLVFEQTDLLDAQGSLQPMVAVDVVVPDGGLTIGVDLVLPFSKPGGYTLVASDGFGTQVALPFADLGDLSINGSQVWYFEVAADTVLSANVTEIGYDASFRLELRDANYTLLDSAEDSNSIELRALLATAGRYYLIARDTRFEPGDTMLEYRLEVDGWTATRLPTVAVPGIGSATAASGGTGTPAIFVVSAAQDATLDFAVTGPAGAMLAVSALDRTFQLISESQGGFPVVLDGVNVSAGASILVAVESDTPGDVMLDVTSMQSVRSAELEPNDSPSTPQLLDLTQANAISVGASLDSDTDVDVFAIDLATDAVLVAQTRPGPSGASVDTVLELLDETGNPLADNDDDVGFFSRIDTRTSIPTGGGILPAGRYYLRVGWAMYGASSADGDYELALRIIP